VKVARTVLRGERASNRPDLPDAMKGHGTPILSENQYQYNGKELNSDFGLDLYDYGARWYDASVGRWFAVDPLAEKYVGISPFTFVNNSPLINREIDGRYFEEGSKSEKQAQKIEKKINKKIKKIEKKMLKAHEKGKDTGDMGERLMELNQSRFDIQDMRNDTDTEYKYSNLESKEAKHAKVDFPTATKTGTNGDGHDVITMFVEKGNVGNQIHESRHGGDHAKGEHLDISKGVGESGYGVRDEVSAYRAQYAYDGQFQYEDSSLPAEEMVKRIMAGNTNPYLFTITNINDINVGMVNSLKEPDPKKPGKHRFVYPPNGESKEVWNSN
jgi:RHS repeat-associated protein